MAKKKLTPFQILGIEKPKKAIAQIEPKLVRKPIEWSKWRDPYGSDFVESEWPGAISPLTEDPEDEPEFTSSNIDEDDLPIKTGKTTQLIATSLGIIPNTEYTNPSKIFNFWNGNTNFPITRGIKKILNRVDGVETLSIFTRYRFRIGIGKLFQDRDVIHAINTKVTNYLELRDNRDAKNDRVPKGTASSRRT